MQSSKLLLDEYPLIILPGLAVAIGLNEAIVLQQIHYWLQHFQRVENECERDKDKRHFRDGHWWVYNSVDEWSDQFPFWGYDTVRRALKSLREPSSPQGDDGHAPRGPLLVATSEYNQVKFDKTLWYTIDYDELDRLCKQLEQQASTGGTDETDNRLGQDAPTIMAKPTHRLWQNAKTSSAKSTDRLGQNPLTSGAKTHNRSALIAPVDPANLHQPIPETTIDYAETSPETTAGAETVAVNRNGLLKRLASSAPAAALLEEFGIDTSVVSPDEVDPITARAWMLYTLVQPDLDNPQAYVAKRLLQRTAPPSQFVDWARLTTQEWQTLWRADRYDGPYLEMLPHRLKKLLPAWAEDFGDIFPRGPFGDEPRVVMDAYEAIECLNPPGRYEIAENPIACALAIVAEDENVADWTQASEERITTALNERGIYHAVEVVRSRTVAASPVEETEIWQTALGQLKLQMTDATFDTWLRDSTLVSRENDKIVVAVKSECARDWLTHRLCATIERTLTRLSGHPMSIEFAVSRPGS